MENAVVRNATVADAVKHILEIYSHYVEHTALLLNT